MTTVNNSKKPRIQLFLLALIFILPLVAGSLLYFYHDHFQFKTTNHGTLLSPPIQAEYLYAGQNEKKWRVIYLADNVCDAQCEKIHFQLNQIQKALGKNRDRVAVILLNPQKIPLEKFKSAFAAEFVVTGKIYLLDPLGNLFMYYPETENPINILKDIKKVLEVSQIG